MAAIPQLPSPYPQHQDELVRVQIRVSPEDKYLLQSIYPNRGIESFFLCNIYHKLCEDLRKQGITTYTPENAHRLVDTIQRYIAAPQSPGKGPDLNDKGRSTRAHAAPKAPKNKPANDGKATSG